jgi:hypothetical protein
VTEQPRMLTIDIAPESFLRWVASQTRTLDRMVSTENGGVISVLPFSPDNARPVWDKLTDSQPIQTEFEIQGAYYADEQEIMNLSNEDLILKRAYREPPRPTTQEWTYLSLIRFVLVKLDEKHLQVQAWLVFPHATRYFDVLWERIEKSFVAQSDSQQQPEPDQTVQQTASDEEGNAENQFLARSAQVTNKPVQTPSSAEQYIFRCERGGWTIAYGLGKIFWLVDIKGLRYIAYLLRFPNKFISSLDLSNIIEKNLVSTDTAHATKMSGAELGKMGMHIAGSSDKQDVLDKTAIANYKQRLDEIREEKESAQQRDDWDALEQLDNEEERILADLNASIGVHGKSRQFANSDDRARQAVRKAISTAIAQIRHEDAALGKHLQETIHTGFKCVYQPGPNKNLPWQF